MQNDFWESSIGRLRDERLFESLRHAGRIINRWRRDFNQIWPHTSRAGLTPPNTQTQAKYRTGLNYKRLP